MLCALDLSLQKMFVIQVRYVLSLSLVYRWILYYLNIINLHYDTVLKSKQTCLFHYSYNSEFEKSIKKFKSALKLTDRAVFDF